MDYLYYLVFYISFTGTLGESYFISEDSTTWATAAKQCQLAEPDLDFSSDTIQAVIPADIQNVDDNEEFWVGYYQTRTAFEYFGCAKKSYDFEATFRISQDPGRCMAACGTNKTIGIHRRDCFCFESGDVENDENTALPYCKEICKDVDGIACGSRTQYVSLYRALRTDGISISDPDDPNEDANCMHYSYDRTFRWDNCRMIYGSLCGKGEISWIVGGFRTWSESTINCFRNYSRPSTYSNTLSIPTTLATPQLWTGIVRSHVVYKYTYDQMHLNQMSEYGYLTRNIGGDYTLKFTSAKTDMKKRLCLKDTTTTSTKITTVSSSTTTSSVSASISKPTTTSSSVQTSSKSSPGSTHFNKEIESTLHTDNEGSSNVGIIVGVVVSVVAVIIFVLAVVILLRKRAVQIPCRTNIEKTTSTSVDGNTHEYVNTHPGVRLNSTEDVARVENAEIDDVTVAESNPRNTVLKKDTGSDADYANNYFTVDKNMCDPSNPGNSTYEKLDFQENPNYVNCGNSQT